MFRPSLGTQGRRTAPQAATIALAYAQLAELIAGVLSIAEKIASNSPTAVQSVKRAVQLGQGEPVEQAIAIMMDEHWRSVVHPDRSEGSLAFIEGREPTFPDPEF